MTNVFENNVDLDRIRIVNVLDMNPQAQIRSKTDRTMSERNGVNYTIKSDRLQVNNSSTSVISTQLQQFHSVLKLAYTFKSYNPDTNMKLYFYLKNGIKEAKGWLRNVICNKVVCQKTSLK